MNEQRLAKATQVRVPGVVYCHEHGTIHDATTDPYGMGQRDCHKNEHRTVYYRARKGDWKDQG